MNTNTITNEQISMLCDRIQHCWQIQNYQTANILMEEALYAGIWQEMMTELRARYPKGLPA